MVQLTPHSGPLAAAHEVGLYVGGAESNVACYLACAGHRAAWFGAVGVDPFGERVLREVSSYGVDTSTVIRRASGRTGVYFKDPLPGGGTSVYYYRHGSAASGLGPTNLDAVDFTGVRIVHLSGITCALSSTCAAMADAAIERARATGALVSFDVNYRPGLWTVAEAAPVLRGLARRADIVFVGRDEAETLWGTMTAEAAAVGLGANRLIVKDGAVGATSFGNVDEVVFEPAPVVAVVEPVGAGDAFAAGYLHGVLRGDDEAGCLRWGHQFAGFVLGSTRDVPTPGELNSLGHRAPVPVRR